MPVKFHTNYCGTEQNITEQCAAECEKGLQYLVLFVDSSSYVDSETISLCAKELN